MVEITAFQQERIFQPMRALEFIIGHVVYNLHCKYLNARSECNDIKISVYSYYPLDPNARVMTVYGNYDVIAFRSCIQIFTVQCRKKIQFIKFNVSNWSIAKIKCI
jgi:hypothetical protein